MRLRGSLVAACVLAVVAFFGGCARTSGLPAGVQEAPATGSAQNSDATGGRLTKDELVARGDLICEKVNDLLAGLGQPRTPDEFEAYLRRAVTAYRGEIAELGAAAARAESIPQMDEMLERMSSYMDLVEAHILELARDPKLLNDASSQYGRALNDLTVRAKALGFTVCGKQGSDSSSGPSGATPTVTPAS